VKFDVSGDDPRRVETVRRGGLPPQRARALRSARERLDHASVERLLQQAFTVDCQVKGARPGNPWQTLERIALRLAGVTDIDWIDQCAAMVAPSGSR